MIKLIVASILLTTVVGCGWKDLPTKPETRIIQKEEQICSSDTKKDRASFILQCLANANPKSDEEPEDWIRECQVMAEQTYCDIKTFQVQQKCNRILHKGDCRWDFWLTTKKTLVKQ